MSIGDHRLLFFFWARQEQRYDANFVWLESGLSAFNLLTF